MDIYIKTSKKTIRLPVLPASFNIGGSMNNTEVNINSIGTINLLGKRGLLEIEIASFFPKQHYNFCQCKPGKPYDYCNDLEKAKQDNDICVLTITGTNINLTCTIEQFSYGEADRAGDVSFSISFKEYRKVSTARVSKKTKKVTYKCKKGDTFYTIARKFTGNSANAKKIAKDNKMKVSKKLKKGKKIKINVES